MKALAIFVLMAGSLWGQQCHQPNGCTDITALHCDDVVRFKHRFKQIKEIFPEECTETKLQGNSTQKVPDLPVTTNADVPAWRIVDGRSGLGYASCADSHRVLMMSEDGKWWCHKVEP